MAPEQVLERLPIEVWHGPFATDLCVRACDALENGKVLVLPLPFDTTASEQRFMDPASLGETRKNVSLDPGTGTLGNAALPEADRAPLTAIMQRFADCAERLLQDLLPAYAGQLERARTSFRPAEIRGRAYTPRHDDRLLHVDAFPSRPLRGRRILRLFTNIAPDGAARHWAVGEPFPDFARRFLPKVRRPVPGSARVLQMIGVTKGPRSLYDHLMLGLHDSGKLDAAYQAKCPRAAVVFPPGVTWLCFTDQVLHAALAGRCALEQTFHLPVQALTYPERSPLRVLEQMAGRRLA